MSERSGYFCLGALFVLSRLMTHLAGVRFDATTLGRYWQYLDPLLLEGELFESVLYLHAQPPLFNLFLGLVLKFSSLEPDLVLASVHTLAGAVCCCAPYYLMRRLAVAPAPALLMTSLFTVSPAFLLYQSWLTYDLPVTALLCVAAVCLSLAVDTGRGVFLHAFFGTLMLVAGTRGLFHPLYFVLTAAVLGRAGPFPFRRVLEAALVPALLLLALPVKNLLLFGTPATSTWLGMNVWRIASSELEEAEKKELVRRGDLSDVAAVRPFAPLDAYPAAYREDLSHPDVAAVAAERRSTGQPNYNHEAYIRIAEAYLRDAGWILRHRPGDYLRGMAKAWYYYVTPPERVVQLRAARERLGAYAAFFEYAVYGRLPFGFRYGGQERPLYLFSTLGFGLLLAGAVFGLVRGRGPLVSFLALTVVYVALIGNSLEVVENARFRFQTDPFLAVLAAVLITTISQDARVATAKRPAGEP